KAVSLFDDNPHIQEVIIFDKHQSPFQSLSWVMKIREKKFDLVVDLRNTAIPLMVGPKYKTPLETRRSNHVHMREKHLARLKTVIPSAKDPVKRYALVVSDAKEKRIRDLIQTKIGKDRRFIVIAPGAANHSKRWTEKGFADVCDYLASV